MRQLLLLIANIIAAIALFFLFKEIDSQDKQFHFSENKVIYLCGLREGQEEFGKYLQGYVAIPIDGTCKKYYEKYHGQ